MIICFQMTPVSSWAILFLLIAWSNSAARAVLIIDDFDDPAEAVTPAMIDQFVETPHVGDLNARRSIRIFGSQAEPTGRIDVNAGGSSAFVAELGDLNPTTSTGLRIVSVQSQYDFTLPGQPLSYVDITGGGANNAFFFSFKSLTSAVNPSFARVILQDAINSYEASFDSSIIQNPRPFTLSMPFESFTVRGGSAGLPDFAKVRTFHFTLRVFQGSELEDLDFHMELDQIRVGRVPEPASNHLAILGLAIVARMRCRGDGHAH